MLVIGLGLALTAWVTRPPEIRRFADGPGGHRARRSVDGVPVLVGAAAIAGLAVGSPLGTVGPPVVGGVVLALRRRRRIERADLSRAEELRALVDHMVGQLRGGGTLTGAFRHGAAAVDGRWGPAAERIDAGQSVVAAFDVAGTSADESLLAATVEALERTGAPATHALERLGDTLRERAAHRAELATQTRHASASAAVLAIMPIGFASIGAVMSSDLAAFYFQTWFGAAAITTGIALGVGGWEWLHRMMRGAT